MNKLEIAVLFLDNGASHMNYRTEKHKGWATWKVAIRIHSTKKILESYLIDPLISIIMKFV
jgi:hypothetical protein